MAASPRPLRRGHRAGTGRAPSGLAATGAGRGGARGSRGGQRRSLPAPGDTRRGDTPGARPVGAAPSPRPRLLRRCRAGSPHPPAGARSLRGSLSAAHLPPRQCRARARGAACKLSSSPGLRAGGAVRSGAERPAPELCSRRAPAAATRGGGRGGSTGAVSFSSARPGRPPPSAEPAGRRAGGGAERGGAGWEAARGGRT